MRGRVVSLAVLAGAGVALAASGSSDERSAAASAEPPPHVIDCAHRTEGPPGWPRRGWRRQAVRIGPIAFVGLRAYEQDAPAPRWPIAETVALVRAGAQVTLRVPGHARDRLELFWQGRRRHSLTFAACDREQRLWSRRGRVGRFTQFNGGFVVRGEQCAPLEVTTQARTLRAELGFGRGCRPPKVEASSDAPPEVIQCTDRVEAGRGTFPRRGWRGESLVAGPLALYGLRRGGHALHPELYDHPGGLTTGTVALVRSGRQITLTTRDVRLLWARAPYAVTFKACDRRTRRVSGPGRVGRFTLFQGGLHIRGHRCATFEIRAEGRARPQRRRVGFGTRCPS